MTDLEYSYGRVEKRCNKLDTVESFGVLNAYSNYIYYKIPLPAGIEYPKIHIEQVEKHMFSKTVNGFMLVNMAKEILLHGGKYFPSRSLKNRKDTSDIYNKIWEIHSICECNSFQNAAHKKMFFYRLANDQFTRQRFDYHALMNKYYALYSVPELEGWLLENHGFSIHELFEVSLIYFSMFTFGKPYINLPIDYTQPPMDMFSVNAQRFFELEVIRETEDLKEQIITAQMLDDNVLMHGKYEIYKTPIIKFGDKGVLTCPIPILIIKRITEGLVYSFIRETGFGNVYGFAFEKLVGRILEFSTRSADNLEFFEGDPGDERQKKGSNALDRMMYDLNSICLIESKTYRPNLMSRISADFTEDFRKDLEKKHIQAIFQLYRSVNDYVKGSYEKLPQGFSNVFPIIIYIETWNIAFLESDKIAMERIHKTVKELLKQEGIDQDIIENFPYIHCSSDELPAMIQIMSRVGIDVFMHGKLSDDKYIGYQIEPYMKEKFPTEREHVDWEAFPQISEKIIDDITGKCLERTSSV